MKKRRSGVTSSHVTPFPFKIQLKHCFGFMCKRSEGHPRVEKRRLPGKLPDLNTSFLGPWGPGPRTLRLCPALRDTDSPTFSSSRTLGRCSVYTATSSQKSRMQLLQLQGQARPQPFLRGPGSSSAPTQQAAAGLDPEEPSHEGVSSLPEQQFQALHASASAPASTVCKLHSNTYHSASGSKV